jgi:hypothetical protein
MEPRGPRSRRRRTPQPRFQQSRRSAASRLRRTPLSDRIPRIISRRLGGKLWGRDRRRGIPFPVSPPDAVRSTTCARMPLLPAKPVKSGRFRETSRKALRNLTFESPSVFTFICGSPARRLAPRYVAEKLATSPWASGRHAFCLLNNPCSPTVERIGGSPVEFRRFHPLDGCGDPSPRRRRTRTPD